MTTVSEALKARRSIRAYLDKEVPGEIVQGLLTDASRSPSGGNLQPWYIHVAQGEKLEELKKITMQAMMENPTGEGAEYDIYPHPMPEKYKKRSQKTAAGLYELMGIARDDKEGRAMAMARNFSFFDAPVGLFFSLDRFMAANQWAHVGMYMQSLALLAVERGLGTCMQEAWAVYSTTVRTFLDLPEDRIFYCGMALGYVDTDAPVNGLVTEREPLENFATFL